MNKVNYKPALLCIVSALLLMVLCFYNGYPVYWEDAHAYVLSAFTDQLPTDRPIFYGKFIRLTSMWTTLWWTIFAQSLLLAFVLLRFIKVLNPDGAILRFRLAAVLLITSFTAVSWVCAVLMPDIFTAILLLAILDYLFDKKRSKLLSFAYILIIFFSVITHYSHFPIVTLFALVIILWAALKKRRDALGKGIVVLLSGVFFYLLMCTLNYADKKKFVFSPSSEVFIVAHFATNGILDRYLDDSCGKKNMRICVAKGQLSAYHWDFLWPPQSSPLAHVGVWDSCSTEFKGIVHDVFTTPDYLAMFIQKSMVSTCRQFFTTDIGKFSGRPVDHWTSGHIQKYFGDEYKEFETSKQHSGGFDDSHFNFVYNLFFVMSTICVLMFYSPSANKELYMVYALILLFFVINAFITANFSTVSGRFQSRIFWILPATNGIIMLKYLQNRFRSVLH